MKQFLVIIDKHKPNVGSLHYNEKEALDRVERSKQAYLLDLVAKEFAYKPEPNDTEISWVVYYTINGTEFSEVFKTRKLARLEKKYLQEHGLYLGNVEDIYIQREEVWLVDKKKVS